MYQITMQKVEEVTHNNEPKDNYYATNKEFGPCFRFVAPAELNNSCQQLQSVKSFCCLIRLRTHVKVIVGQQHELR